jgi:NAD(P)H-flavin reductase/ferredoxin
MGTISLTIDGRAVSCEQGATVLDAAKSAGIPIPTLCAHEDLEPFGGCRLCVVEIEGMRGYPTSCTTPATDGMVVKTNTGELHRLRNRVLQLLFSHHPNACLVCNHRADCEKYRPKAVKAGRVTRCSFCSNRDGCLGRQMVLEVDEHDLKLPVQYSFRDLDRSDPFMDRDYNLCLLCGRCWRICEKIHGKPAISIMNRGRDAMIGTAFDASYVDSGCTFCGACIDICPAGALADRYARWRGEPKEQTCSTCTACGEGCPIAVLTDGGKVVGTRMTALGRDARLCAVGRFAYPLIMDAPRRLRQPAVEEGGELIPVPWDEAVKTVAEKLGAYKGASVVIVDETQTRESLAAYERFAREVVHGDIIRVPAGASLTGETLDALSASVASGQVKAALVAGDFLDGETIAALSYVVVADFLPSLSTERVNSVLPVAVLAESGGSFLTAGGQTRTVAATTAAPGEARPEWQILSELATAMGAADSAYAGVDDAAARATDLAPPAAPTGAPRDKLADVPGSYRGHYIANLARGLEAAGFPTTPAPAEAKPPAGEGFRIVDKQEVVPNFHRITIEAPAVAKYAKPGQFAIVMVDESSERIPYTLIDWDANAGTVTFIIEEVGRSSREIVMRRTGDRVAHVSGPLGTPFAIENVGTVALGGGCYGLGAIYPVARALKEAGNTVICCLEASTRHLLYMEDELSSVADEILVATKDGSVGVKGGVQELFVDLLKRDDEQDVTVAVGRTFMMRMASEATKPFGAPLQVALKTIMVDGTGMCGACRVSVAGETKFACIDGPFFDGHAVDWDELMARLAAFAQQEVDALPQVNERTESAACGSEACTGSCAD